MKRHYPTRLFIEVDQAIYVVANNATTVVVTGTSNAGFLYMYTSSYSPGTQQIDINQNFVYQVGGNTYNNGQLIGNTYVLAPYTFSIPLTFSANPLTDIRASNLIISCVPPFRYNGPGQVVVIRQAGQDHYLWVDQADQDNSQVQLTGINTLSDTISIISDISWLVSIN